MGGFCDVRTHCRLLSSFHPPAPPCPSPLSRSPALHPPVSFSFYSSPLTRLPLGPHSLFHTPLSDSSAALAPWRTSSPQPTPLLQLPSPWAPSSPASFTLLLPEQERTAGDVPGLGIITNAREGKPLALVGRKDLVLQPSLLCHSPTTLLSLEVLGTVPHLVNK